MDDNKRVELLTKVTLGITEKVLETNPELEEKIWANLNAGQNLRFTIKVGNNKAHFEIDDKQIEVCYDLVTMEWACPFYDPIEKIDDVIATAAAWLAKQSFK